MANFQAPVAEFMATSIETVGTGDPLAVAEKKLEDRSVSSLPVLGPAGALEGVITRSDLLRVGRRQAGRRQAAALLTLPSQDVASVMSRTLYTVSSDTPVQAAARILIARRTHRVLVVDAGVLQGILSTRDVMRVIEGAQVKLPLHAFMSSPVCTVRSTEPLSLATDRLRRARLSGLVVVEDSWPIGVFTQVEAIAAHALLGSTPVERAMSPRFLSLAADTRLHRAAAQAAALGARRVLAMHGPRIEGILTGLDFAKAAT